VDSVNTLISELVQPTSESARVLASVSPRDLSQRMPLELDERELLSPHLTYSRFRYSTDTSHYNRGKPALQTPAVSQQSAQNHYGLAIFSISDAGTRLPRICRNASSSTSSLPARIPATVGLTSMLGLMPMRWVAVLSG
jgi:hypothetical protein